MASRWLFALVLALILPFVALSAEEARGLDIYFIDVEGGAATLIVTPQGESVLIDCGFPGTRDAERIHEVATKQAGLKAIDHLIITHWHTDHYGGTAKLAKLLPIRNFYDHGIPDKLEDDPKNFPLLIQAYRTASENKSKVLKLGDEVALKQLKDGPPLRLLCVCGNGEVLPEKPGAAENPLAKEHKAQNEDKTDNARSLGFVLSYGSFRFLDLGDLTWNIEYKLVAPSDKLGPVDVYQVTHHGMAISNNPVLIKTVKPHVAIMNNGPRKGGDASVVATLRRVPEIQAIYQLHRNVTTGAQENADPEFIANPDEKCQGESIRLSVAADGKSYTVTVGSKGKPKKYETRVASVERGEGRTKETFTKVADRMVEAIIAADYEGVRKDFNKEMLKEFSAEKCKEFFRGLSDEFGKIDKLESPQLKSEARAVFLARCKRGVLDFTLVLDEQGRVAGFLFKPHSDLPVPEKNETKLSLPFKGQWLVQWGGDTEELNHHHNTLCQRFAFDFLGVDADGKTHKGDGTRNEDYFAFGREVFAPADGVVTEVIEGVRDNTPGSMNSFSALGNVVFVQHAKHEVSALAHLKQGSVMVKVGDTVKKGQLLGLCGNSGNSSEPHLHYQLQNTPVIQDATGIKCYFEEVVLEKDGKRSPKKQYSPVKGDIVDPE
jgi:beta-lactamase superfamily II metal-dependent hydrolase